MISTFAGTGKAGFSGDGGPVDKAKFNFVMCITLDPAGKKMHVSDLKNLRIREIDMIRSRSLASRCARVGNATSSPAVRTTRTPPSGTDQGIEETPSAV